MRLQIWLQVLVLLICCNIQQSVTVILFMNKPSLKPCDLQNITVCHELEVSKSSGPRKREKAKQNCT